MRPVVVASLAGLIMACSPAEDPAAVQAEGAEARRALEAEIIEADRALAREFQRTGLAGFISGFTLDGRFIEGGKSHIGPEGIRRALLPAFADSAFDLTWDPVFARVADSGELGYTVGTYEMKSSQEGRVESRQGTYLSVWRRQDDGRWKIEADIGNSVTPE